MEEKVKSMISGLAVGYRYPLESDMKEVCDKCKQAYNGDWQINDCKYCTFMQTVKLCRKYAWELGVLNE